MIFIALLFVILGYLVKNRRMYFLIAGYNTMSDEEKAKYDIEEIATLLGNVMNIMAFILALGHLFAFWFNVNDLELYVMFPTILIGVIYLLIKMNSKKYKRK